MAQPALAGEPLPEFGQEHATIRLLHHEPLGDQAPQRLRDRRLCHPEASGDIDLARLAAIGDQIGDQLDIVLQQRVPAGGPGLPEPSECVSASGNCAVRQPGLRPARHEGPLLVQLAAAI